MKIWNQPRATRLKARGILSSQFPGSNTDKLAHQHSRADSSASAACRPHARRALGEGWPTGSSWDFLSNGVSVENWEVIAQHVPEILSLSHLSPEHRGTLTVLTICDRLATLWFQTRVHEGLLPASSQGRPAAPGLLGGTSCVGCLPFRSTLTTAVVYRLCVIIWLRPTLSYKAPSGSGQDFLLLSTILSICQC